MAVLGMFYTTALVATLIGAASGQDVEECRGECVGMWDQCDGRNFDGPRPCCDDNFRCFRRNEWYSQCRDPDKTGRRWSGPFDCEEPPTCGPESRTVGELYFAGVCDYTYLGQYNLEDCDRECRNGGYVGCERHIDAGDDEPDWACYGYTESSDGACGPRNGNDFWIAWLTCLDRDPAPFREAEAAFAAAPADEADVASVQGGKP